MTYKIKKTNTRDIEKPYETAIANISFTNSIANRNTIKPVSMVADQKNPESGADIPLDKKD